MEGFGWSHIMFFYFTWLESGAWLFWKPSGPPWPWGLWCLCGFLLCFHISVYGIFHNSRGARGCFLIFFKVTLTRFALWFVGFCPLCFCVGFRVQMPKTTSSLLEGRVVLLLSKFGVSSTVSPVVSPDNRCDFSFWQMSCNFNKLCKQLHTIQSLSKLYKKRK